MLTTETIISSIDTNMRQMQRLYIASRLLRAELDIVEGRSTLHTSVNSLMHELES